MELLLNLEQAYIGLLRQSSEEIARLRADARSYANVMLSEENDRLIEEIERLHSEIRSSDVEIEHRADQYSTLLHENERLRSALRNVLDDIRDYERTNNLAPNPPRLHCWDSVARAYTVLGSDEQKDT